MKIRKITFGKSYGRGTERGKVKIQKYYISIDDYSLWAYLRYRLYHFYDMRAFKVPGFERYFSFLDKHWPKWADQAHTFQMPRTADQDLKCYHYSRQCTQIVKYLEIDKETYELATKGRREYDWEKKEDND